MVPGVMALDITTLDGKAYKDCEVSRVFPDSICVLFSGGGARVQFTNLPEPVRQKYGYNPEQAANFAKAEAAREDDQVLEPAVRDARRTVRDEVVAQRLEILEELARGGVAVRRIGHRLAGDAPVDGGTAALQPMQHEGQLAPIGLARVVATVGMPIAVSIVPCLCRRNVGRTEDGVSVRRDRTNAALSCEPTPMPATATRLPRSVSPISMPAWIAAWPWSTDIA